MYWVAIAALGEILGVTPVPATFVYLANKVRYAKKRSGRCQPYCQSQRRLRSESGFGEKAESA